MLFSMQKGWRVVNFIACVGKKPCVPHSCPLSGTPCIFPSSSPYQEFCVFSILPTMADVLFPISSSSDSKCFM